MHYARLREIDHVDCVRAGEEPKSLKIEFKIPVATKQLPPSQPSFFEQPALTTPIQQFVNQYFTTYDNNRQGLLSAYTESCHFSLTIPKKGDSGGYGSRGSTDPSCTERRPGFVGLVVWASMHVRPKQRFRIDAGEACCSDAAASSPNRVCVLPLTDLVVGAEYGRAGGGGGHKESGGPLPGHEAKPYLEFNRNLIDAYGDTSRKLQVKRLVLRAYSLLPALDTFPPSGLPP